MKYLIILAGAVVILVSAWLVFRRYQVGTQTDSQTLPTSRAGRSLVKLEGSDLKDQHALHESVHGMSHASRDRNQALECVGYLKTLVDSLDDSQWNSVATQLLSTWEHLRAYPETLDAVAALEPKLIGRFAGTGTIDTLEALVKLSTQPNRAGERVKTALETLAHVPIRSYQDSRPALLISAAMRAKELGRAKSYVSLIALDPSAGEGDRQHLAAVGLAIDDAIMAQSSSGDPATVIQHWAEARNRGITQGPAGRGAVAGLLVGIGTGIVRSSGAGAGGEDLAAIVKKSASQSEAAEYWSAVITDLQDSTTDSASAKTALLAAATDAYAAAFGRSNLASEVWLTLVQRDAANKQRQLHQKVQCLDWLKRALTAAADDDQKLAMARELKKAHSDLHEYKAAQQILSGSLESISNAAKRGAIEDLIKDLGQEEIADGRRVQDTTKKIQADRLSGQLAHMKDRLEEAKKAGRSPQDISSLETVVKDLELQYASFK